MQWLQSSDRSIREILLVIFPPHAHPDSLDFLSRRLNLTLTLPFGCKTPRPILCISALRVSPPSTRLASTKWMKVAMKVKISAEAKCRPRMSHKRLTGTSYDIERNRTFTLRNLSAGFPRKLSRFTHNRNPSPKRHHRSFLPLLIQEPLSIPNIRILAPVTIFIYLIRPADTYHFFPLSQAETCIIPYQRGWQDGICLHYAERVGGSVVSEGFLE